MNLQIFKTALDNVGQAFTYFLKAVTRFVSATAPIAEVVGVTTGHPEVVVGAKLAEATAAATEDILKQQP
jgi:hypothetical protein